MAWSRRMRPHVVVLGAAVCAALVSPTAARMQYQQEIPNGDKVYFAGAEWPAVGHVTRAGHTLRNQFGLDFQVLSNFMTNGSAVPAVLFLAPLAPLGGSSRPGGACGPAPPWRQDEGYKWTVELCKKDSDNDGRHNGLELGDPDCVWWKGEVPDRTEDITHPGLDETDAGPPGSDPAENLDMPPHTHDGQGHGHPSHGHHEDAVGGLGLLSLLVCIPAVVLLVLLGYCAGKRARGHARDASFASGVDLQDQRGDKISRVVVDTKEGTVPPAQRGGLQHDPSLSSGEVTAPAIQPTRLAGAVPQPLGNVASDNMMMAVDASASVSPHAGQRDSLISPQSDPSNMID